MFTGRAVQTQQGDIWMFGLVVLEMLTGDIPWPDCDNPVAMCNNLAEIGSCYPLMEKHVDLVSTDNGDGDYPPAAAVEFVECCLHSNPNVRWSAKALLGHPFLKTTPGGKPNPVPLETCPYPLIVELQCDTFRFSTEVTDCNV
eukprot:TRINITY_DN64568_c0_g3_i2.p2 TRINITY_DN64568_c0_g3~~TRINITY_DN64568_c0_g3_i2.p2  ORF type:complete len:143 (-),score=24.79 TRINITY_DN64568_c0_g3_i2:90-518(-)